MQDIDNTPAAALSAPAAPVPAPDVQISLRMPAALLALVDAQAARLNINRASVIRMTLTQALPAAKGD